MNHFRKGSKHQRERTAFKELALYAINHSHILVFLRVEWGDMQKLWCSRLTLGSRITPGMVWGTLQVTGIENGSVMPKLSALLTILSL